MQCAVAYQPSGAVVFDQGAAGQAGAIDGGLRGQAFVVQGAVEIVEGLLRVRPEGAEAAGVFAAALEAGTVSGGEGGELVGKEELRVAAGGHEHAAPPAEVEPADNPAPGDPVARLQLAVGVVKAAAAVAHPKALFRNGVQLAPRVDAVLERHEDRLVESDSAVHDGQQQDASTQGDAEAEQSPNQEVLRKAEVFHFRETDDGFGSEDESDSGGGVEDHRGEDDESLEPADVHAGVFEMAGRRLALIFEAGELLQQLLRATADQGGAAEDGGEVDGEHGEGGVAVGEEERESRPEIPCPRREPAGDGRDGGKMGALVKEEAERAAGVPIPAGVVAEPVGEGMEEGEGGGGDGEWEERESDGKGSKASRLQKKWVAECWR